MSLPANRARRRFSFANCRVKGLSLCQVSSPAMDPTTINSNLEADLQHISNRKYILCDRLKGFDTQELIVSCPDCAYFFSLCCGTNDHRQSRPCHHFRLVFTDGACKDNGRAGATAGLGIAFGRQPSQQFSIPVDETVDPDARRTSQRAELLAALEGLRRLGDADEFDAPHERLYNRHGAIRAGTVESDNRAKWIVTTDSEYVVKGMTDWLPNKWKVCPQAGTTSPYVTALNQRRCVRLSCF